MNSSPIMVAFARAVLAWAESASQLVSMEVDDEETMGYESNTSIDVSTDLPTASTEMTVNRNRRLQNVITEHQSYNVAKWMVDHDVEKGVKGLKYRAVRQLPVKFRGEYKANIIRENRYWRNRQAILPLHTQKIQQKGYFVSIVRRDGFKKCI